MSEKEPLRIIKSFLPPVAVITVLWIVKIYEWKNGVSLSHYGIQPRTLSGLGGIALSPFLHGDFKHLISNSIPLLVLGGAMAYFYRSIALKITVWIMLLGGFWLWLGGRDSYHIGASGVIYGLTTFLFFSGALRRDTRLMAVSLLVVFLYGGMIWGLLPILKTLSWEGHLFGSLAGILMALIYRKDGPQRPLWSWETAPETEDDEEDAYWKITQEDGQESVPPSVSQSNER